MPTRPQLMGDHMGPKNSSTNGDLIGTPPSIFDGDRSKADKFITQFHMFRILNDTHPVITNPMKRVVLALSYIAGPKVDAWVSEQFIALSKKVFNGTDNTPTHADTNEALWEDFMAKFKRAFAESIWEMLPRLENLQLHENDIEMYIATYENLMRRAERKREDEAMMSYFYHGLPDAYKDSIMGQHMVQHVILDTIDDWQSAARDEAEKQAEYKYYS